jgi:hypothetical protein
MDPPPTYSLRTTNSLFLSLSYAALCLRAAGEKVLVSFGVVWVLKGGKGEERIGEERERQQQPFFEREDPFP